MSSISMGCRVTAHASPTWPGPGEERRPRRSMPRLWNPPPSNLLPWRPHLRSLRFARRSARLAVPPRCVGKVQSQRLPGLQSRWRRCPPQVSRRCRLRRRRRQFPNQCQATLRRRPPPMTRLPFPSPKQYKSRSQLPRPSPSKQQLRARLLHRDRSRPMPKFPSLELSIQAIRSQRHPRRRTTGIVGLLF